MLTLMRKHAKSPWIKVLLLSVAVSFVIGFGAFMYVGKYLTRETPSTHIASVNGIKVSYRDYVNELKARERYYQKIFGDNYESIASSLNLKQQVLEQLIERALLLDQVNSLDLRVSNEEVRRRIGQYEAFKRDGKFDLELYQNILRRHQLTPQDFEAQERESLAIQKMADFISSSAKVSEGELWDHYVLNSDKINLRFVGIDPKTLDAKVTPSEQEVTAYFENHLEDFRVPEKRSADYLVIDPAAYADQVTVAEDEIYKYYEDNLETLFTEKEQVSARHILIKVDSGASPEVKVAARTLAEDLMRKAGEGEDFAELAKQYSQDEGTRDKGGDLGFFARGRMQKPFEEAAFSLEEGEIGGVVETSYGFHVIKVEQRKPEREVPIDEARVKITDALNRQKQDQTARSEAERLQAEIAPGEGLVEFARDRGLEAASTEHLASDERAKVRELGFGFLPALFQLTEQEISPPTKAMGGKYYLIQIKEIVPSRLPELDEVRDRVAENAQRDAKKMLALQKAESILQSARAGKSLDEAVAGSKLKTETTGLFSLRGADIPNIGSSWEMKRAAFALAMATPYPDRPFEVEGKQVVFELIEHRKPQKEEFDMARDELRSTLLGKKGQEAFAAWIDAAKSKAEIEYNAELMARL